MSYLLTFRVLLVVFAGAMFRISYAAVPLVRLEQADVAPVREAMAEPVMDDILPVSEWRRVHAKLGKHRLRSLNRYLAGIGVNGCCVENPQTCNSSVAELIESFVLCPEKSVVAKAHKMRLGVTESLNKKGRMHLGQGRNHHNGAGRGKNRLHGKEKRSTGGASTQSNVLESLKFRFLNAAPDKGKVSLSLLADDQGGPSIRRNLTTAPMAYQEGLEEQYQLVLEDLFAVETQSGGKSRQE